LWIKKEIDGKLWKSMGIKWFSVDKAFAPKIRGVSRRIFGKQTFTLLNSASR